MVKSRITVRHRGFAAVDLENGAAGDKISRVCRMVVCEAWIVKLPPLLLNWLLLLLDLGVFE